jgi:hypothetical protein
VLPPDPPPLISPVDLPPTDAVEVPRIPTKKGKKVQSGRTEEGSTISKYPYSFGAIYKIPVGITYPVAIMFPPLWIPSTTPLLHAVDEEKRPAEWTVGYGHTGKDATYQAIWYVRPNFLALDATTPVMFEGGQFMTLHFTSQDKRGVLAVAWEGPETQPAPKPVDTPVKPLPVGVRPPKIALDRLHIQYKIEGGKTRVPWMPVEAYDDGNLTVIRFAESLKFTSAPVLAALEGKRTLPIEYTVFAVPDHPEKGEFFVARGLYKRFQLRDGKGGIVTITRLPTPEPTYTEKQP